MSHDDKQKKIKENFWSTRFLKKFAFYGALFSLLFSILIFVIIIWTKIDSNNSSQSLSGLSSENNMQLCIQRCDLNFCSEKFDSNFCIKKKSRIHNCNDINVCYSNCIEVHLKNNNNKKECF